MHYAFFLRNPCVFRLATSPSANQRLALTSWITLIHCLAAMTGNETTVKIHGTVLSILLARAISRAPALHGFTKIADGDG